MVINRFEIYLVNLDPTQGREIKKTRPALIISPNEMNHHTGTAIIAPMTTKEHPFPTRIECRFQGKRGWVALDQIRTVDKARLVKKLGIIDEQTGKAVLQNIAEIFAP
ncbi:MAG: type II toxin-antitoxin system PemK/MazF family toxin [Anaerolineales bacterium]|nr:type II toxin-antitoxin system PemK/MazF family toxin [Anaerolineales bacterium]